MDNVIALRQPEPGPDRARPSTDRQAQVLVMIGANQANGMTWREVSAATGLGHGSVSAALSRLHAAGKITRLSAVRDRLKIYVLPEWVGDRETETPRRTRRHVLLDDMAAVLARVPTRCEHYYEDAHCRSCEIKRVLRLYNNRQY